MDKDWQALAAAMKSARVAKGLTQAQLAEAIGVSRATIQSVEQGRSMVRVTRTLLAMARALGWPEGRVEAILDGRWSPEMAPGEKAAALRPTSGLPLSIEHALTEGDLIDAQVAAFAGGDAQLVTILMTEAALSHDQLRAVLVKWRELQAQINEFSA
ncbi:helix-turn-helix domain-containing protein [Streptomyces sp. NPDC004838]